MPKLRINLYTFVFNALFAVGLCYIYASKLTLSHYIDIIFILFLTYTVLTFVAITIRGGFYDGFTFGFRRFRHEMSRHKDYLESWKDKPLPSEQINKSVYHVFLFQSIALMVLMIVLILLHPSYF